MNHRFVPVKVRQVDDAGIALWGFGDRVLDVLFDDRRVWSFWLIRDTEAGSAGQRFVRWPEPLRRFLDGRTTLSIREHVSGRILHRADRNFGTSTDRIAVVGRTGAPMGLDKSGRLTATFDTRSEADTAPLLDAIEKVLAAIHSAGIEGFLSYGNLLGAVREGRFLGHDSDADLSYLSRFSSPADVVRESFALQRVINSLGFATQRYSGAAFRIDVVEGDGVVRGLDVFAGFIDDGVLYVMGEVAAPFRPEWVYPTSEVQLQGRSLPAPADPQRWLAATYGPNWRTPDPAFKFETSARTDAQLSGWFRGTATNRPAWERAYSGTRDRLPKIKPSPVAARLFRDHGTTAQVVEIGAGRCADALWLARQGVNVSAYDFVPSASRAAQHSATEDGLALEVRSLNLTEWRSVFAEGARLAHRPGPKVVLARHVLDATSRFGRDSLLRFASMSMREGGSLYVDVWTGDGQPPSKQLRPVSVASVVELIERHGGTILRCKEVPVRGASRKRRYSIGRVVASWPAVGSNGLN